jgi:hypothetical protein
VEAAAKCRHQKSAHPIFKAWAADPGSILIVANGTRRPRCGASKLPWFISDTGAKTLTAPRSAQPGSHLTTEHSAKRIPKSCNLDLRCRTEYIAFTVESARKAGRPTESCTTSYAPMAFMLQTAVYLALALYCTIRYNTSSMIQDFARKATTRRPGCVGHLTGSTRIYGQVNIGGP